MADQNIVDDQMIVSYLLGTLSEKEIEKMDEMSVTNDDFAERLRDVENDLVDAYVKGELSGETLARFKSHYLASARRRHKVRFAESFRDMLVAESAPIEKEDKLLQQIRRSPVAPFAWKFRPPAYVNAMLVLVIALLIYPTYRSFILEREVTKLQHEIANLPKEIPAPSVSPGPPVSQPPEPVVSPSLVFPVRPERDTESKTIRITFNENKTFSLLFSLPSDNFERFILEINQQNRNIWREEIPAVSGETSQLISMTLQSEYFQKGEYELKISGKEGANTIQLAIYELIISE